MLTQMIFLLFCQIFTYYCILTKDCVVNFANLQKIIFFKSNGVPAIHLKWQHFSEFTVNIFLAVLLA